MSVWAQRKPRWAIALRDTGQLLGGLNEQVATFDTRDDARGFARQWRAKPGDFRLVRVRVEYHEIERRAAEDAPGDDSPPGYTGF